MIKLDLTQKFEDLDGNKSDEHLGFMLAEHIARSDASDAVKFLDIAKALRKNGYVEVDRSDLKKVRDFVESCKTLNVIGKGSLLVAIDACKEKEDKKAK
jgi:hypothetical protein